MSDDKKTISIQILDKEYQVACPLGEQVALMSSARYLDQRMREVRSGTKLIGHDRIAVMAALNVTNDLLNRNAEKDAAERYNQESVERMHSKLDNALARFDFD